MRWFAQKNFTSWSKSLSLSMGKLSNSGEKTLWTRWKRAEYHSVILSEVVLDHSSSFGAKSISRVVEPVVCQLLAFATHCNSFVLVIGHPRFDPSIWRCWVSICCWMWKPVMNVLWISVFVIAYMKLIRRTGQVVIWYENIWYIFLVSSCFFQFHPHIACREASVYVETGAKRFLERTWGERAKRCILRACGAKCRILIRFCIILVRKLPVYLEALRSWGTSAVFVLQMVHHADTMTPEPPKMNLVSSFEAFTRILHSFATSTTIGCLIPAQSMDVNSSRRCESPSVWRHNGHSFQHLSPCPLTGNPRPLHIFAKFILTGLPLIGQMGTRRFWPEIFRHRPLAFWASIRNWRTKNGPEISEQRLRFLKKDLHVPGVQFGNLNQIYFIKKIYEKTSMEVETT